MCVATSQIQTQLFFLFFSVSSSDPLIDPSQQHAAKSCAGDEGSLHSDFLLLQFEAAGMIDRDEKGRRDVSRSFPGDVSPSLKY